MTNGATTLSPAGADLVSTITITLPSTMAQSTLPGPKKTEEYSCGKMECAGRSRMP